MKVVQIDLSRFGICDTIVYGSQETEYYPSERPTSSGPSTNGKTSHCRIGSNSRIQGQSFSPQRKRVAGISTPGTSPHHPVRPEYAA